MGPQLAQVTFSAEAPTPTELAAEAKRLGGLKIESTTEIVNQAVVAFSEFPNGLVTVSREGNRLSLSDFSLIAPILFELLLKASISLGGRLDREFPWSLCIPVSREDIHKATRQVHFASAIISLILIVALVTVMAIVAGVIW